MTPLEALHSLLYDRLAIDDYIAADKLLEQITQSAPVRLSSDKAAMVAPSVFWVPITPQDKPVLGAKTLLIRRESGVAQVARFTNDGWYDHYFGLPKFKD